MKLGTDDKDEFVMLKHLPQYRWLFPAISRNVK